MGLQEGGIFTSRWWPFAAGRPSSPCQKPTMREEEGGGVTFPGSPSNVRPVEERALRTRDALSIADSLEKGLVHEFAEEFLRPVSQPISKLVQFYMERSPCRRKYRLFRQGGEFLMYADVGFDSREVRFFQYDPDDRENTLYDPDRPAYVMTYDQSQTDWLLRCYQEDYCYSPQKSHRRESQDMALFQHSRTEVGAGVNHCLDAEIVLMMPDSGGDPDSQSWLTQRLVTRHAVWNEEMQTLVLDFRGREIIPSAKNFQLAQQENLGRMIFQHGKIAKHSFALDFRWPLNIPQAFAMAISTVFWE